MKIEKASEWLDVQRGSTRHGAGGEGNKLHKVVKDTTKIAEEQVKGLSNQVVKNLLFNRAAAGSCCAPQPPPQA